jgi:2,3-bisphosphoglycerate-dependent phosphoglycerate mutase
VTVAIVFETHATSTDNEAGIATGWLDGELSEAGRRQAIEFGERRRDGGFAAVFTSDLARAVQTVEIAYSGAGVPIHHDWRLRECNYGLRSGMPASALERERPQRVEDPFPAGESYRDVVIRVRGFLADLTPAFDGRRILLVGHTATRWALDHLLAGADLALLVRAPFEWQPGWSYELTTGEGPRASSITNLSRPPFGV